MGLLTGTDRRLKSGEDGVRAFQDYSPGAVNPGDKVLTRPHPGRFH